MLAAARSKDLWHFIVVIVVTQVHRGVSSGCEGTDVLSGREH